VRVEGDAVRLPWPADTVRSAPSYEAPHNVTVGQHNVVDVDSETERRAYEHYGVEPMSARADDVEVVRFTVWRIQTF
jgi:hypothetical protein